VHEDIIQNALFWYPHWFNDNSDMDHFPHKSGHSVFGSHDAQL
jgi:hypothetical protein